MPRWLRFSFYIVVLISISLLIFTASGGATANGFEKHYPILRLINTVASGILCFYIVFFVYRLYKDRKNKVFGARMTGHVAATIAFTALLPCVILYFVSSQFIGRSIDSWFDVRVENALESGVTMSSQYIEREKSRLLVLAQRSTRVFALAPKSAWPTELDTLRADNDLGAALLFRFSGEVIASSLSVEHSVQVDVPTKADFLSAIKQNGLSQLEGEGSDSLGSLRVRSLVPLYPTTVMEKNLFIQLTRLIPLDFATNAANLVNGYRDYQEVTLTRTALREIYRGTLGLTLMLVAFIAISIALGFAQSMTDPILQLATGTKRVAQGDLHPIREFKGNDEINALTQSFNSMVTQIAEAQKSSENQRLAAEEARAYLESVLATISSGVIVLDSSLTILSANAGANHIMAPLQLTPGTSLKNLSPQFANVLKENIVLAGTSDFEVDCELPRRDATTGLPLFVRGSQLTIDNKSGWVIVFDNMSSIINAQKALAWTEVARRLAHEIKNPLTPIRLAAERLEIKLADKLDEKDARLLHRTSSTIVSQVDAMKQMVNDFRDYAKLPSPKLVYTNLNPLIENLVAFYATANIRVKTELDPALPAMDADANQMRQILHNLIGNAVDATNGLAEREITIQTTALAKENEAADALRIVISDNGPGFAPDILARVFEPYVTTKPSGTGLGLPMVKKIIEEHHGKVSVANRTDNTGAQITIMFPATTSSPKT